jgi:hypothetical protein
MVTWTHLAWSDCKVCKIFKWQGLTFVGVEDAVLENSVTIVVNCYDVDWHMNNNCKSDIIECYCKMEFVTI